MRKSLVALAVLGAFSGAAFAQSNVTLYGILDVNYTWESVPTKVGNSIQSESRSAIDGSHQSGNRWGIRGSEDLGGGLSAVFALEQGFTLDTAEASSTRAFHRQAYLGLSDAKWGAVVAGRLATFSSGTGDFDMIGRIDPFATGFKLASAGNAFISMNALRVDNAIAYQTPTFAGFKAGIGYSTAIAGSEAAGSSNNNSAVISGVNWTYGPFFAAVTYDAVNAKQGGPDQKHLQIGGTFDISSFRLHAGWASQTNIGGISTTLQGGSGSFLTLPTGFQNFDADAYLLGATWTVTPAAKLLASYQAFNAKGKQVGTVNFEPDFNIWAIGGTYNLSRRTNLYTSYAYRSANGTLNSDAFDAKQFALGIRHLF